MTTKRGNMKDGSQCSLIAQALKRGRTLTMLDIYLLCGSLNGHRRLAELRQRGFRIHASFKYVGKRRIRCWRLSA